MRKNDARGRDRSGPMREFKERSYKNLDLPKRGRRNEYDRSRENDRYRNMIDERLNYDLSDPDRDDPWSDEDDGAFEGGGKRIHDAWDRFSNHEDRDFDSEYERDRLEREYGPVGRGDFGYRRYPSEDYGDYRSGPDDDLEYSEDLRNRAYDDTRYSREAGYSDVWRGERNAEQIRNRPRTRGRKDWQR